MRSGRRSAVQWLAQPELSAVHATYVVATGAPCTDPKTEGLLVGPVTEVNNRLLSASLDVGRFWKSYLQERIELADPTQACVTALVDAGCGEMQVDQTAGAIKNRLHEARTLFLSRFPKISEQLDLRARPLRERWETLGEGLLRDVERQIWNNSPPDDFWPAKTTGWLVQPIRGGDGDCDSQNDRFWIEAMLTDADPGVPEVVRVAWLMTKLAIENHTRHRSSDTALVAPWQYASVPLVLSAAAEVELLRGDELPIARAMELWHFGDAKTAARVEAWWKDFKANPTPLPVALRKLT